MKKPIFKVGDEVEFELSEDGQPRWSFEVDEGGNGEYRTGKVMEVDTHLLGATIPIHTNPKAAKGIWYWPMEDHNTYSSNQWNRPGYLRKIAIEINVNICTCTIDLLMLQGCKCGEK